MGVVKLAQSVEIRLHPMFSFISIDDIPEPWREQFLQYQYGSQCPVVDGLGPCAYSWDWKKWIYRLGQ